MIPTVGVAGRKPRWRIAVIVLAGAGLAAWVIGVGPGTVGLQLREAVQALAVAPAEVLLGVLALALAQNVLAGLRLHVVAGFPGGPGRTLRAALVAQLANTFLPARAGDGLKILALGRGGGEHLARAAGGVLLADKLVDAAVGAVFLVAGAVAVRPGVTLPGWRWAAGAVGVALVGGALVARIALRRRGPGSRRAWKFLAVGLSGLTAPRRLAGGAALAAAGWTVEASAIAWLSHALGHPVSLPEAFFALAVLNLAVALPITPANAGTFEAGLAFALAQAGVPGPAALAVAVAHHACQIGGALAAAGGAWTWPRRGAPPGPGGVEARHKESAIAHYDAQSQGYDARVGRGLLRHLRARERAAVLRLARLDDPSKLTVIDVGCGGGFYSRAAKGAGKWVHAVDAAPGMVERVRPHVDAADVADLELLAPGRTYDIVLCCGVLDFVVSPERAFGNLCRLCAPGGRLVVLVPRAGVGGLYYRLEKWLAGFDANVYRREWFVEHARRRGLTLSAHRHPLPSNMALCFEAPLA